MESMTASKTKDDTGLLGRSVWICETCLIDLISHLYFDTMFTGVARRTRHIRNGWPLP
jgi:hypothetical protein